MKFQVSDGEKYQKVMEAEISAEEMDLPIKLACKRLAEKVNIPGFRKGKAPRSVLENFIGIQAILEEAADDMLGQAYVAGLKETGLEPVAKPEVEVTQLAAGQPMKFTAIITVKPGITLGQYKELPVTRRIIQVSEADIDQDIAKQQQRLSKLVDAPEGAEAKSGDTVTIDFKGLKDGVAFDGGTAENYPLVLGSNSFIPGFEDQLLGAKQDEERSLEVTFPAEYQEKSLAGQDVVFEVKVKEIKVRQLPELDDAFVQEVSETAETMEQLRADVRKYLEEESKRAADDNSRVEAIAQAVEKAEADIPPVMIEQQIDQIVAETNQRLQSQGLSFDAFLQYTGQTMEQIRETYQKQAEFMVKRDLVVEAVAEKEQLQAEAADIDAEIGNLAKNYWQTPEKIRETLEQNGRLEDLAYSVRMQKAADFIYANAVVTDEIVDREQMMQEAAAKAAAQAAAQVDDEAALAMPEADGEAPETEAQA